MLPKKYKLKRNNDFKKVFERGRHYQQDFIRIKILKNNLAISRFGFLVGLKVSKKATKRNKIRRQLEETVRLNLNKINSGFDTIISVSPEIIEKNYQEIEKTLIDLFKKIKLLWNY